MNRTLNNEMAISFSSVPSKTAIPRAVTRTNHIASRLITRREFRPRRKTGSALKDEKDQLISTLGEF
jgi:hypothetical protein